MTEFGQEHSPYYLQDALLSILKSLPQRSAVRPKDFLHLPRDQRIERIKELKERDVTRANSELANLQLFRLRTLLGIADITQSYRSAIFDTFETYFKEGISGNFDPIINTLGIMTGQVYSEGIFSKDPNVRKMHERSYMYYLQDEVRSFSSPSDNTTMTETHKYLIDAKHKLYEHEEQYEQKYGESITYWPSSIGVDQTPQA